MGERKTYLITTTQAETPQLWLAQTDSLSELALRVAREGGGLRKGVIFHLGLDSVQSNNCMEAKLLEKLVEVPPRDFQLWTDELLRRATVGRPRKEAATFLLSALEQIKAKLDNLLKESQSEHRSETNGVDEKVEQTSG